MRTPNHAIFSNIITFIGGYLHFSHNEDAIQLLLKLLADAHQDAINAGVDSELQIDPRSSNLMLSLIEGIRL